MKLRSKIILVVAVIFVILLKFTPWFVSDQIVKSFKKVDESFSTSYISDSTKLKLHIDSMCNFSPEKKELFIAIFEHNRKVVRLIDTLHARIDANKTSIEDLDIAETELNKNALGDTLFQELKLHLSMAENMVKDDSSKIYFQMQRERLSLDAGKSVWMEKNFHTVPAVGGMTILSFFRNKTQEMTLTALQAPAGISVSGDF